MTQAVPPSNRTLGEVLVRPPAPSSSSFRVPRDFSSRSIGIRLSSNSSACALHSSCDRGGGRGMRIRKYIFLNMIHGKVFDDVIKVVPDLSWYLYNYLPLDRDKGE
ncbi:hypothetical protein NPIL_43711 [Nephila pilipes]|uniref:Uncharacterized protein n=1 Tax=Nephila pilipes TaxID=299642 RepID=A0A8X6NY89_NEPPI|nr:hypothetical protein NPIL_43711 [Nephila pilipes]